jgi:hypothetical protein
MLAAVARTMAWNNLRKHPIFDQAYADVLPRLTDSMRQDLGEARADAVLIGMVTAWIVGFTYGTGLKKNAN